MYDLATRMQRRVAEHAQRVNETTTESDIVYLPSQVGVVKAHMQELAKLKRDWKIEVLDDDKDIRRVQMEKALTVSVWRPYWNHFQQLFREPVRHGMTANFGHLLQEAYNDEMEGLRQNLKPELIRLFTTWVFDECERNINRWRTHFGILQFRPQDVVISYSDKKREIHRLYNTLMSAYNNDKGTMEMLIDAMLNRQPLSQYVGFRDKDFLFGAAVQSRYQGTVMIFEATVDQSYMRAESVRIMEPEALDAIEENLRNVKIVRDVIYPRGPGFDNLFFRQLRNILQGRTYPEEEEEGMERDENV